MSEGAAVLPEHVQYLIDDIIPSGGGEDASMLLPLKEITAIAVRDVEKKAVQRALISAKGNKTKAASMLQIDFKTLQTKIREYGIQ